MLQRDRMDVAGVALVVLLCATWGAQQVVIKASLAGGLPAILQAGIRSAGAALLVAAWVVLRGGSLRPIVVAWRPGLAIAALFGTEFLCLYPGVQHTTAARAVLFLYTAPFFTALVAHAALPAERLRPQQILGLAVAFGGVALAFADGLANGGGSLAGDLLCLAAGALWGVTTPFVKASSGLRAAGPAITLLFQLAGSAPILLLAAALVEPAPAMAQTGAVAWAGLLYQAVVVAFASYLAWFWMISRYPATRLAGFTFLTPVFGILASALVLGERPGSGVLAGVVAIAVGLRLLNAPIATARPVRV